MQNDIDLSNDALLKHRAIAEKATPGPWEPTCRKKVPLVTDSAGDDVCRMLWHRPTDTAAHIAANSPNVVIAHIDEILRLRAEVKRLNKEADWLAHHAWKKLGVRHMPERDYDCMECPYDHNCVKCWREWACKEVEKRV